MSVVTAKPIAGYTAEGKDAMQIREWANIDLFDTLNEDGVNSVRNGDAQSGEHVLAALLTLNAQNMSLTKRVSDLEVKITGK